MNTKNGKCGVFAALTAALLVTAALITSCPEPEERIVYRDGYQPPPGMGYITINAPGFTGRTILPSPPGTSPAGDWEDYDLSIQEYEETSPTVWATKGSAILLPGVSSLSTPIPLAPGYYVLTITANIDGTPAAAARGSSIRFTISPGAGQNVSVTLKPLPYSENANGTFAYEIEFGGYSAAAEMTITTLVGTGLGRAATSVVEGTDDVDLTPGSYLVFLEATVGSATASLTEVVNIHQNLTSFGKFVYNGTYFVAYIDGIEIHYENDDVKPILTGVSEGGTITLSKAAPAETATISIAAPAGVTYTSTAWYCGSSSSIGSGNSLLITAGTAPFDDPITYPVTVVGQTATGAYSASFRVKITH